MVVPIALRCGLTSDMQTLYKAATQGFNQFDCVYHGARDVGHL